MEKDEIAADLDRVIAKRGRQEKALDATMQELRETVVRAIQSGHFTEHGLTVAYKLNRSSIRDWLGKK